MIKTMQRVPAATLLVFAAGLLAVSGCTDPKQEEEIREARAKVAKLELRLAKTQEENSTLKAELNAAKLSRDEFQAQLSQLARERDQALQSAQQAQEAITELTARRSGQADATADLEKQVADLTALVETLSEQLQKGAAPTADVPAEVKETPTPVPEPNQGL